MNLFKKHSSVSGLGEALDTVIEDLITRVEKLEAATFGIIAPSTSDTTPVEDTPIVAPETETVAVGTDGLPETSGDATTPEVAEVPVQIPVADESVPTPDTTETPAA